jgi:hypothetical protein
LKSFYLPFLLSTILFTLLINHGENEKKFG